MYEHKLTSCYSRLIFTIVVASIIAGCDGSSGSSEGQSASAVVVSSDAPPTDVTVGAKYYYQPRLTDGTGPVTYSIASKPGWATFDTSSGVLSGAPSDSDVGESGDIAITVAETPVQNTADTAQSAQVGANTATSGATAGSSTAMRYGTIGPFRIRVRGKGPKPPVAPVNNPPSISGTPATTVVAGQAYEFTPAASDPDGNTLLFSVVNRPSWAAFDTNTGVLSGTPTVGNVGTTPNVVISVTDSMATVALKAFSIQVTAPGSSGPITRPVNAPPTISGTPINTVTAGSAYSFTPAAKDSDGNALTFSVQNKPAWATFNTTTGQLLGTPTAANVGSYANVVIAVSDGQASASLPAFTLTVSPSSIRSATLSWTAPTQNTDGSALTDLGGYRIYYGTSASALNQTITVSNAGLTTYVIDSLATGTWYFAVKSLDTGGVESDLSGVVSDTIG
jgi:Putative Ig domain